MLNIGFEGLFLKFATVLVALIVMHAMGWIYDRSDKIDSAKAYDLIEADAGAASRYYGYRLVAFAIVVGLVLA